MTNALFDGLLTKRTEIAAQLSGLQLSLYHIDATLQCLGYEPTVEKRERLFRNGELIRCIGNAERAGLKHVPEITEHVMRAKSLDTTDTDLRKKMEAKVRECRKRADR